MSRTVRKLIAITYPTTGRISLSRRISMGGDTFEEKDITVTEEELKTLLRLIKVARRDSKRFGGAGIGVDSTDITL